MARIKADGTPFKSVTEKRVGPPCNPTNAPGGCGRPLPVTGVPKDPEAVARLQARFERDQKRLATIAGITVKPLEKKEE